ncbi:uncharacterized protein LOC144662139 isoform X1 [Oculina patagonica]
MTMGWRTLFKNEQLTAAVAANQKAVIPEGADHPADQESDTFRCLTTSAPEVTSAACVTCAGAGVVAAPMILNMADQQPKQQYCRTAVRGSLVQLCVYHKTK